MLGEGIRRVLKSEFNVNELTQFQKLVFDKIVGDAKDAFIHSGTGTGKTLAYLLPILHIITTHEPNLPVALLQPNRILKAQIEGILWKFSSLVNVPKQFQILTPRQCLQGKTFPIRNGICVVDEADLSLSAACLPSHLFLSKFLDFIGSQSQNRLIYAAATLPQSKALISLKSQILRHDASTAFIEDPSSNDTSLLKSNEHFVRIPNDSERIHSLLEILKDRKSPLGKVMVFVLDKEQQMQLRRKVCDSNVIVTTDLLARGYDISDLQMVVHLNPPRSVVDYIHRVGRLNRLNSLTPPSDCHSYCLLTDSDVNSGPAYLKPLLSGQFSENLSALFSRNRSLNKKLKKNKL